MSENFLATAQAAAKAAGDVVTAAYGNDTQHSFKNDRSLITKTDLAAEAIILDVIQSTFPDHAYYSEEAGASTATSDYVWVIDPLDGTSNFAHQIPFWCTSIGLTYRGQPIVGVIYAPLLDELYTAERGTGAFLNGKPIQADTITQLTDGIIGFGSRTADHQRLHKTMKTLLSQSRTFRVLGSFALHLCYVATGRLTAQVGAGINAHDGAAGALIASESGALVTDFDNKPWQPAPGASCDLVAATPALHQSIVKLLKNQ